MPKLIDHAKRRRLIVDAAWEVVAADGVGALTLRRVAEAAHIVPGSLRHIFPIHDALVDAVAEELVEQVRAAVQVGASRYPRAEDLPLRMLSLLPLDEPNVRRWRVEHALYVGATQYPRFASDVAACRNLRGAECASIVRALSNGLRVPEEQVDLEILRALALVEGLSHLAVHGAHTIPAHEAQVVIRRHLLDVRALWHQRTTARQSQ
jgi:AcrR family transcriptional regulator